MRLKYYLRGLGLGIAVTAIVMTISARKNTGTMSDAQIIARARELGMVDGVLTEIPAASEDGGPLGEGAVPDGESPAGEDGGLAGDGDPGVADDGGINDNADGSAAEGGSKEYDDAGERSASVSREEESGEKAGAVPAEGAGDAGGRTASSSVIVAIYPGESSYMVSRKLATLGLVESADIYDDFLCQNGYDKKLSTGNYEIKAGASAEEIARIICKSADN